MAFDRNLAWVVARVVIWVTLGTFLVGTEEHYFLSTRYVNSTVDSEYICGLARCEEARLYGYCLLTFLGIVNTILLVLQYPLEIALGSWNLIIWSLESILFVPLRECGNFAVQITSIALCYKTWKHLHYVYRMFRFIITRPRSIPEKILYALGYVGSALCVFAAAIAASIREDHRYRIRYHDPEWFLRQVQAITRCL